ncbi:hypothetical protein JCM5296_002384 [Sporobolomyces johnsonii]
MNSGESTALPASEKGSTPSLPPAPPAGRPVLTFRRARPSDAASGARCHLLSWRTSYAGWLSPSFMSTLDAQPFFGADRWRERCGPDRTTWVAVDAEADDEVYGFCTASAEPDEHGYYSLQTLYVRDEAKGCGVGRRLVEAVLGKGTRAVTETGETYEPARRFYEKLGFTRVTARFYEEHLGIWEVALARDAGGPETPGVLPKLFKRR